jgi:TPP-dependent pyruvate/acetoin dehydrogenase alpha subunit
VIGTTTVIAEGTGRDRASAADIETAPGLPIEETETEMEIGTAQGIEVRDTMMTGIRGTDEETMETMRRQGKEGTTVAMMIGTEEVCTSGCPAKIQD